MNTKAIKWITGSDTGTSSKTIWSVMMGAVDCGERYDRPYDGADFGRCYRLLELMPEWKPRLAEVAARFPAWAPIVREWSRIEAAYLADLKGRGIRSCRIIRGLNDECMAADGFVKTGPHSWTRNQPRAG